jgi:hypothetical protein
MMSTWILFAVMIIYIIYNEWNFNTYMNRMDKYLTIIASTVDKIEAWHQNKNDVKNTCGSCQFKDCCANLEPCRSCLVSKKRPNWMPD